MSGCQGLRLWEEMHVATKGSMKDSDGNENVLCLICVSISILVVILFYSFARCCCWGKLGKGRTTSLYYFILLHRIYNFLSIKSLTMIFFNYQKS